MAQPQVKFPAAIEVVIPAHRVKFAHFSSLITFFIDIQQKMQRILYGAKVVDLIQSAESIREVAGNGEVPVDCFIKFHLRLRVTVKVSSYKLIVPGPFVFRGGGGVNTQESAALPDVVLKSQFLRTVQYVASCAEKDDGLIFFQIGVVEDGGVFCRVYLYVILLAQAEEHQLAGGNGGVAVTSGC